MASPEIRWVQRLDNYRLALAVVQRALAITRTRELTELEELGLIQAFECTHELS